MLLLHCYPIDIDVSSEQLVRTRTALPISDLVALARRPARTCLSLFVSRAVKKVTTAKVCHTGRFSKRYCKAFRIVCPGGTSSKSGGGSESGGGSKSRGGGSGSGSGACYKCGQDGHWSGGIVIPIISLSSRTDAVS